MVGALIVIQALTLFTTPVIYLYLDQVSDWIARRRSGSRPQSSADTSSPSAAEGLPGSPPTPKRPDHHRDHGQRRADPEVIPKADLNSARFRLPHYDQIGD